VVSVVRAIAFPESFRLYLSQVSPQGGGLRSFILAIDTDPIVFLLLAGGVLYFIYFHPRDEWTAWGALFGSAAVVVLLDWLSIMDGIVRIIVYMIFVGCNLYAFAAFRRCLKRVEIPSSPNAGPATE
jgi:hypothetical protein